MQKKVDSVQIVYIEKNLHLLITYVHTYVWATYKAIFH